jgi:hypothetical protein
MSGPSGFHLAQLNVGRTVAPIDDPRMAGFVDRLAEINALAERSPGYVWRLKDESGDATSIHVFDDPLVIVNLTVWESPDQLADFAYRTAHVEVLRQRSSWFEPYGAPYLVLWWIPAETIPDVEEAKRRLNLLAERGPTPEAFTLKARFPSPSPAVSQPTSA